MDEACEDPSPAFRARFPPVSCRLQGHSSRKARSTEDASGPPRGKISDTWRLVSMAAGPRPNRGTPARSRAMARAGRPAAAVPVARPAIAGRNPEMAGRRGSTAATRRACSSSAPADGRGSTGWPTRAGRTSLATAPAAPRASAGPARCRPSGGGREGRPRTGGPGRGVRRPPSAGAGRRRRCARASVICRRHGRPSSSWRLVSMVARPRTGQPSRRRSRSSSRAVRLTTAAVLAGWRGSPARLAAAGRARRTSLATAPAPAWPAGRRPSERRGGGGQQGCRPRTGRRGMMASAIGRRTVDFCNGRIRAG